MSEVTRTDITGNGNPAPSEPTSESSIPTISDFQGKPTIVLNPGSRWPFSMGLAKARLVLANAQFIQRFVDSNGTAVE
jgi:hypothetical protein